MARTCSLGEQQWKGLAEAAHYRTSDLAKLCNCPVRQLRREFRRELGCSPQGWLNEHRISTAKNLLLSGEPVKNVASAVDFKYESYFRQWFKNRTGMTPKEFVSIHNQAKKEYPSEPKPCPKSI